MSPRNADTPGLTDNMQTTVYGDRQTNEVDANPDFMRFYCVPEVTVALLATQRDDTNRISYD